MTVTKPLREVLTISQIMDIRKMGRTIGITYAAREHGLDEQQLNELQALWPEDGTVTSAAGVDPHRSLFITVAWLLGASQAQLGRKFDVAQQTIVSKLDRTLRYEPNRQAIRLAYPPMEWERLERLHSTFYELLKANPQVFDSSTPRDIALALMHSAAWQLPTTADEQPEPAYELDTPERRLP